MLRCFNRRIEIVYESNTHLVEFESDRKPVKMLCASENETYVSFSLRELGVSLSMGRALCVRLSEVFPFPSWSELSALSGEMRL